MSVAVFGTARSKWMSNEAVRVCSLLKEAQPLGKRFAELGSGEQWHAHDDAGDEEKLARGRLLSRYGVWMLVELCPPNDNADVDVLGRLISMLFQVHSFKPRPASVNHFYNQTYSAPVVRRNCLPTGLECWRSAGAPQAAVHQRLADASGGHAPGGHPVVSAAASQGVRACRRPLVGHSFSVTLF